MNSRPFSRIVCDRKHLQHLNPGNQLFGNMFQNGCLSNPGYHHGLEDATRKIWIISMRWCLERCPVRPPPTIYTAAAFWWSARRRSHCRVCLVVLLHFSC